MVNMIWSGFYTERDYNKREKNTVTAHRSHKCLFLKLQLKEEIDCLKYS